MTEQTEKPMSLFEDDQYRWRETYFVLFPAKNRPSLDKVRQALSMAAEQLELAGGDADDNGRFESITVVAPDDFAAIDVSFLSGDEVREQANQLADDMTELGCEADVKARIRELRRYDGRFDVLHFEQVGAMEEESDDADGMLNPSTLLLVLDCLARLTDGAAIDPQTGTFV